MAAILLARKAKPRQMRSIQNGNVNRSEGVVVAMVHIKIVIMIG